MTTLRFHGERGTELVGWALRAEEARARVLLVHGLGDHAGRYRHVAISLAERGLSVFAYDQRGHGESSGPRGDATSVAELVADLDHACRQADEVLGTGGPLFLLGHSMGGTLVLYYLQEGRRGPRGAVVSAPWLAVVKPPGLWLRIAGSILTRLAPSLSLPGPLRPELFTRDPERAEAYRRDPLVHSRMSPRLFFDLETVQKELGSRTDGFGVPVLFVVPGADPLVDAGPTVALAHRLRTEGADLEVFEGLRHEPFQEVEREDVIQLVGDWLLRQLAE